MQYNENFTAQDDMEELLMLAGRVEAVGAYLKHENIVYPKVIASMLGLDIGEEEK